MTGGEGEAVSDSVDVARFIPMSNRLPGAR